MTANTERQETVIFLTSTVVTSRNKSSSFPQR